jgi:hypothetical protein
LPQIKKGTYVQIHDNLLAPGERAVGIPEETAQTPLQFWVKGFLLADANQGEAVEIETKAGRVMKGTLVAVNPPYEHNFARPTPELITISEELREFLGQEGCK